jgi:hypothetical protein
MENNSQYISSQEINNKRSQRIVNKKSNKVHEPLGSCDNNKKCDFNCDKNFSIENQREINRQYNEKNKQQKRDFLLMNTTRIKYNNNDKYSYYLKNIEVCRKFFLNTIGYTSNSIIWNLYKAIDERNLDSNSLITAPFDKRTLFNGNSFKRKHSDIFEKEIEEIILSKNPKHSHYSIESVPNRLYIDNNSAQNLYEELAHKLNFQPIYREKGVFTSNQEQNVESCSYYHFLRKLREMNISFSIPTVDKCGKCVAHENHHQINTCICDIACDVCSDFKIHVRNARLSREKSRNDENLNNNYLVVSCDMQKILQVPILKSKDSYFNDKLNIYNETFVTIGKNSSSICYVSNESQMNKNASDICNFYHQFFNSQMCESFKEVIIKCDNSCQQNKSWILYGNILRFVNNSSFLPISITFDYYESGHSYMAADSLHANITKNIKKVGQIFDYNHMIETIKSSRKNIEVKDIKYNDVIFFKDITTKQKPFYLKEVKSIKFIKGSLNVFVKKDYEENSIEYDILSSDIKNKLIFCINNNENTLFDLEKQLKPVGISYSKYIVFMKNLELVPEEYWESYVSLPHDEK